MTIKKPLVSIIMPTYNRCQFIERAINSCLNQTYENIEVIVIDDNNPDSANRKNTKEKIEKLYGDNPKVKYIEMDKNSGAPLARNKGIELSKGEYITFLDDDDEYYENNIEEEIKFITSHDYDMIFCNIDFIDESTGKITKKTYEIDFEPTNRNWLRRQLLNGISGGIAFMFKKEVITSVGGFSNIKASQEYILMLKAIGSGFKVGYFDFTGSLGHVMKDQFKITGSKSAIEGKKQAKKIIKKYLYVLNFQEKREVLYKLNSFIFRQYFKFKDIRFLLYGFNQLFYIDFVIKNKKLNSKNT